MDEAKLAAVRLKIKGYIDDIATLRALRDLAEDEGDLDAVASIQSLIDQTVADSGRYCLSLVAANAAVNAAGDEDMSLAEIFGEDHPDNAPEAIAPE
jgi:hypothetical protein